VRNARLPFVTITQAVKRAANARTDLFEETSAQTLALALSCIARPRQICKNTIMVCIR
jgi:hypothetical protein